MAREERKEKPEKIKKRMISMRSKKWPTSHSLWLCIHHSDDVPVEIFADT